MQGLTTPGISASGVALFKGEQAVDKVYRAQDAAIANPDPPRRFRVLPKWTIVRPQWRAIAMQGVVHRHFGLMSPRRLLSRCWFTAQARLVAWSRDCVTISKTISLPSFLQPPSNENVT